jgi:AbrB family looped-hinge helix DNA binding protein
MTKAPPSDTKSYHVKVARNGRLVIPAPVREALGLADGGDLILEVADNHLRLQTVQQRIREAQALVRKYVPANVSLADELIAERRAEAERE